MTLPRSTPGRIAAIVGAALLLLFVVSELALPGLGEGGIEERLTENGGVAEVSLGAFPAARLLWGSGDDLDIRASGLDIDLDERNPDVFDDLDRFDKVGITMESSRVGPVELDNFALTRRGNDPYALVARGETSPAEVAEFLAEDSGIPGSGILGGVIDATGIGGSDLPLEMNMRLASDDGRIQVVEGGGEIAGIPTGPLAELITNAIVERL